MKDIVREYQEQFRRHRIQLRRYTALMLALAMVTALFVNWQLHSDGIAKTADYLCNKEEHTHTADCYPQVLVCGYEEGEPEDWTVSQPDADIIIDDSFGVDTGSDIAAESAEPEYIWVPHEHTDDCYAEVTTEVPVLTCMEEEHVHTNDCYDPEDNTLICEEFEHTHDDSCYTIEYETEEQLVCGYEEGELVEELNPDYNPVAMFEAPVSAAKPVVTAPVAEGPVHHHTDACYAPDYTADPICGMEEHHHDVNCLSDPLDGVDDESDWLDKTGTALTGVWNEDLLTVAQGQLGYEQSEKNFKLDTDDGETLRYYTRYGAWYGNSYGAGWDVMFLSYCLNHANIPQSAIPQESGAMALHSQLRGTEYMGDFSGGMPIDAVMPGDIVFYTAASTKAVVVEDSRPAVSDDSPEADIALLSMDEAAAASEAPQIEEVPFTGTTVGIVSDVDQDAGTLTVISGNVDGKVAEVTPDASQVTSLVSVATAQAVNEGEADTMEGNLNLDPKSDLDGSPYVLSFDLKVLKNGQYVTPDEYKLSETVHGMVSLKDIPASEIKSHNYQVCLKLPDSFKVPENTTGSLIDTLTNAESGRYTFQQDSAGNWYLVLNYNEDYIAADEVSEDSKVSSKVEFDFQWDESKIKKNEDNTISLPGHDMIIRINDDTQTDSNYSLDKTGSSLTYDGYVKHGSLRVKKVWKNHDDSELTDTSNLNSIEVTLTKHIPSTVTVTFVGGYGNALLTKTIPKGASLITRCNSDQQGISVVGTATWNYENGAYYFNDIQSDLTVTFPSYYVGSDNSWLLDATELDTTNATNERTSIPISIVKLDNSNNWTALWENLEISDGITYTIDEVSVDGYTASYTLNNEALEAGTPFELGQNGGSGDTIVITNTADETGGYELPSTGGAGTKLYTAGGGALMLAALVCGVCRKRRRERRAR